MLTLRKYMGEAVGWTALSFSLSAFSLNSMGLTHGQSLEYLGMNIVGCFFMILYAVSKKAHASSVLNTIFLLVAVIALVRAYFMQP
ncbi:hypothetical protein [Pontibacter sp. BAB1700]|uniref:CBU_0592 family membrane protein n=1 Tax=Pontibacter sp. BAB1700 TaxID=1144253 RepID=UPI00026BC175|nr:hypothetical protein [Pontibacter sp. BAB1700]EJF10260.1 hypothetical protein O71_10194 [Pontibacter sp. BAB1700]